MDGVAACTIHSGRLSRQAKGCDVFAGDGAENVALVPCCFVCVAGDVCRVCPPPPPPPPDLCDGALIVKECSWLTVVLNLLRVCIPYARGGAA